MKQVLATSPVSLNAPYILDEKQAHHLFDVLRTGSNETVRLVWENEVFLARPEKKPELFVFGKEEVEEPLVDITLCTALIKQDHFEWLLQKAAELGVNRIVPFVSENTVVKLDDPKRLAKKMERWTAILEGAVNQSNRNQYVLLEPLQRVQDLKNFKSKRNLLAYEKERDTHISQLISDNPESITVVLGPEGGFSPKEAEQLMQQGFEVCSLGNNILRAETAALYVLSAIEYQTHLQKVQDA